MPDVERLARRFDGRLVWSYDQVFGALLRFRPNTGICAAAATEWIRHRANGSSLASVVGGDGAGRTRLRATMALGNLQYRSTHASVSQDAFLENWLAQHGVVPSERTRTHNVWSTSAGRSVTVTSSYAEGGSDSHGCPNIENDIVYELRRLHNRYARINVTGSYSGFGAGHVLSVWIGDSDAILFDPNHGEIVFRDVEDFFYFFPVYYRQEYRNFPFRFTDSWAVLPCVRARG